jgi:Ca2+-transporting ATPase
MPAAARQVEGLTADEAAARRARHGPNELAQAPPVAGWKRFLAQFRELVIWILIAAALISLAAGDTLDALAILALVLLNAVLGFVQESRGERAIALVAGLSLAPTVAVEAVKALRLARRERLSIPLSPRQHPSEEPA